MGAHSWRESAGVCQSCSCDRREVQWDAVATGSGMARGEGMIPAVVGQLGLQAAKDLIDRLFGKGSGPVPGFGTRPVGPGGRAGQIVIINGSVTRGGPDRGAADTRAVIECALSLLARLPGIEVTFRLSEGGAWEVAVRRAAGAGVRRRPARCTHPGGRRPARVRRPCLAGDDRA